MNRPFGMFLVLGFLASSPNSGFGQKTETERGVPITLLVYDRANTSAEILAVAKQVVLHLMTAAGFAPDYIVTQDMLNTGLPIADPSKLPGLPRTSYLSVVITPTAFRRTSLNEAGLAAVTRGPYRRAYVFLDR